MGSDAIFLITGDELVELSAEAYESEQLLQDLLERYPDLLAGAQISPSDPRRWALVKREKGVPKEEGGSVHWSADHLFLDQDGIATIVEVKRSSDTRIRREVVGQMLDYASNGVRYWPVDDLRSTFEDTSRSAGRDPDVLIRELIGDEDIDMFWATVGENLSEGRVRLLFVADRIPAELQSIVEFLNDQMGRTEVLAIEIKQYVSGELRTLVPRVIGMTSAGVAKQASRAKTYAEHMEVASQDVREVAARFEKLASEPGYRISATKAARRLQTKDGRHLCFLYPQRSVVEFSLDGIRKADLHSEAEQIWQDLSTMAGHEVSTKSPWVKCSDLLTHWTFFVDEVLPLYADARKRSPVNPWA